MPTPSHSGLERRRDELSERVAELQWDLGGLAYEMAIRDHFRLDVLVSRAAMLQERDAELAKVEQILHTGQGDGAGLCTACGALRSRGAVFCYQCGATLMAQTNGQSLTEGTANGSGHSVAAEAGGPQRGEQNDEVTLEFGGLVTSEPPAGLYPPVRR